MQYYPPYWLDETTKRFQDGDGQELNATDIIAPLRHLVNIPATLAPQCTKHIFHIGHTLYGQGGQEHKTPKILWVGLGHSTLKTGP